MKDLIVIAFLVIIISTSAFYVYRAKKKGKKCVGCSGNCPFKDDCPSEANSK